MILLDLIGIKKRAIEGNSVASASMQSFHLLVSKAMRDGLTTLDHAYVWNDSVLLLAYLKGNSYEKVMRAADELKRQIDAQNLCYAIAVKGRSFPAPAESVPRRVTVLRASSYAMANCFAIEKKAKDQRLRKSWYVDARIVKHLPQTGLTGSISVKMLPTGTHRQVYVHGGYLWDRKSA